MKNWEKREIACNQLDAELTRFKAIRAWAEGQDPIDLDELANKVSDFSERVVALADWISFQDRHLGPDDAEDENAG